MKRAGVSGAEETGWEKCLIYIGCGPYQPVGLLDLLSEWISPRALLVGKSKRTREVGRRDK